MQITAESILLVGSLLLILNIIASKTAGKAGIPVLLLFLGVGMIAGTDGIGKIAFDDPAAAQFLGILALTYRRSSLSLNPVYCFLHWVFC